MGCSSHCRSGWLRVRVRVCAWVRSPVSVTTRSIASSTAAAAPGPEGVVVVVVIVGGVVAPLLVVVMVVMLERGFALVWVLAVLLLLVLAVLFSMTCWRCCWSLAHIR